MFIGGLNWETTERKSSKNYPQQLRALCAIHDFRLTSYVESLKDYFSQFGEVSECTVMRDSATGRSRGFGFLTFKDPKCVNTVMVKEHYLDGKIVRLWDTRCLSSANTCRLTPSGLFPVKSKNALARSS